MASNHSPLLSWLVDSDAHRMRARSVQRDLRVGALGDIVLVAFDNVARVRRS